MVRPAPRRTTVAATLLVIGGLLAGCSGDEPPAGDTPSPTPGASSPTGGDDVAGVEDAALEVRVGAVTGELSKKRRRAVSRQVGRAVDRWYRAAWLGDDYPRGGFGRSSFPGFTDGARRNARRDRRLTTNAALGRRIDEVRAVTRDVRVDLFAPGGRPAGATARVRLVLVTSGDAERRVRVSGRLLLTPGKERWRIFGYDLARSDRPAGKKDRDHKDRDKKDRGRKGKR